MSKAILVSIKPKWCVKIMNGEKTIEVRKNKALANAIQKLIDENGYADIYVYCTKDNKTKLSSNSLQYYVVDNKDYKDYLGHWNGKVLFKFRCYKTTEYVNGLNWEYVQHDAASYDDYETILEPSCLTDSELINYVDDLSFCAIHISDLEIFDKPKELSDFYHWTDKKIQWYSVGEKVKVMVSLTKAPQNYCYVKIGK